MSYFNRLGSFLLMMTVTLFSLSCEEKNDAPSLLFKLTSDTYQVSDLGGIVYLPVASNVEWEVVPSSEEWITFQKESDEMILMKVAPNGETVARETSITIKEVNGRNSDVLKIVQAKVSSPRIEITDGKQEIAFLSLNGEAKSVNLIINSNTEWTLEIPYTWIKTDVQSGGVGATTLVVSVEANSSDPRDGELIFTVTGGESVNFKIAQNGLSTTFDSPTHYFYATFGTMPTLYAGLHALSHNKPSFFFYERHNTYDPEMFPPHVTLAIANGPDAVQDIMRDYMKKKILEIRDREPNAIFGLLVDDLRARIGYDWFVGQGIDSSRVKVSLLSDGTATYNVFSQLTDLRWDKAASDVEALNWNPQSRSKGTRALPEFNSGDWAYYMATLPNYRLVMQNASLFEPATDYIREQMGKMETVSLTPLDLLNNLSPNRKETFYKMASFNKEKFAAMFDKSPKKNLVIIGTNTTGTDGETQRGYVQQIYSKYAGEYDLFFKPHPADANSGNFEELFVGMTLLPGQMPFEIFVWALMDKIDMIGGYDSTVFITVPIEKVRFIFGKSNASEMVKPNNLLFKDADIDWIN